MRYYPPETFDTMTEYSRQDVDFRIQISRPADGIFVLGLSVLGGPDVLGDGYQWDVYDDTIVEMSLQRRNDVTSNLFLSPIENTAVVTLREPSLDPNINPFVHPNTKIKIDWLDVATSTWSNYLTGFVSEVDTVYNRDASNLVVIYAEDPMRRFLNTAVTSYTHAEDRLDTIMDDLVPILLTNSGLNDSVYTFDYNPTFYAEPFTFRDAFVSGVSALDYSDTVAGQIIQELMQVEIGSMYWDETSLKIIPRDTYGSFYRGYSKDFDDFTAGYSTDYIFSTVQVSMTSAPDTYYAQTNPAVSGFFGEIVVSATLPFDTLDSLLTWLASITSYEPKPRIKEFSTPYFIPIKNNQVINVVNDYIGETSNDYYSLFTDCTITVTPDSVSTTMNLYQPL